jgi:tetratricopeptide (TPR) repeat protein
VVLKLILFIITAAVSFSDVSQCVKKIQEVRQNGLHPKLESYTRECLKAYPENAALLRLYGLMLFENKKFLTAADAFEEAIKQNKDLEDCYFFLLRSYLEASDPLHREKSVLDQIFKKFTKKPRFLAEAGNILVDYRRMKSAFDWFVSLLESDAPDKWLYHLKLGQMYQSIHQKEEATAQFSRAVKLNPDSGIPYFYLARSWEIQGNKAFAESLYKYALQRELPEDLRNVIEKKQAGE